jgi:hypothetical protein
MALFDPPSEPHLVELGLVVVVVKKLFNKPENTLFYANTFWISILVHLIYFARNDSS